MSSKLKSFLLKIPGVVWAYRTLFPGVVRYRENRPLAPVMTPFGFRLSATGHGAHKAMMDGGFEEEEIGIINAILKSSDVFVDIGANIGLYTCIARANGRAAIAVEPQQRNLTYLYENLAQNGWSDTEVFPIGLGEKCGLQPLFGDTGPSASLLPNWAGVGTAVRQTIPVSKLDIILGERFQGQRLLIKIDVEGFEYAVLKGAYRTLSGMRPKPAWMMEICLNEYHPGGLNPHYYETFDLFWQNGYEVRTANAQNRLVSPDDVRGWMVSKSSDSGTINYICRPLVD